ncbi:MAG: histidinol-phosphate transaminase [Eubacterium sp.]
MNNWKNNLRKIEPYVPGEQSKEKNIVKLNANENPYPPSPMAVKAIKEYSAEALRLYPPADATPLKQAIASFYGVNVENVFVGNGSDDVIALAFQSFFNGSEPILFPDITYSFYPVWCRLFNIDYETPAVDDNFRIVLDDYKKSNGGIVIPNPNAPTSICEDIDFVDDLLSFNSDSVVIIDEAYVDFGGASCVPLIEKYENLLVTGTFSKSRSLAGLRIGFAIGSKALISVLEAVKNSYNSYTVDSLSVAAGVASMNDREYFNSTVSKIINTRNYMTMQLRAMGFEVLDSSANFVFASNKNIDIKDMFEYLKSKKVFIRYFDLPRINNYVRISVGTDEEVQILLDEIKKYVGD